MVCGHTNCVGVKKAFQTASTRTAKAKPHLYDHSHHDDDANAHTSTIIKQWIEPLVNLAVTQGIPEMGEKAGISKLVSIL